MKYEISLIRKFDEKVREMENSFEKIIKAHIGDVKYPYPQFIEDVLCDYIKGKYDGVLYKGSPMLGKWSKYSPFKGFPIVREAIAENEDVEADNILPCVGAMGGIFVSLKAVSELGVKKVFIPDVGFNPYYINSASLSGLKIFLYNIKPTNGRVEVEMPEPVENSCILINFPHNPTGYIAEENKLETLMKKAREKENCWIISDNPYKHIYLRKKPTNLISLSRKLDFKNFVEIVSFSKLGPVPGVRTGYIYGEEQFIEKASSIQFNTLVHPPNLSQILLYFFAKEKDKMDKHYASLREEMKEREKILEKLDKRIERVPPDGAIYEMVRVGKDDVKICEEILEKKKVSLAPGSGFGNNGKGWTRIAFGALEREEIEELVERLNEFLL